MAAPHTAEIDRRGRRRQESLRAVPDSRRREQTARTCVVATFIGLDLAWKATNESGICWLEGESPETLRCTRIEAAGAADRRPRGRDRLG